MCAQQCYLFLADKYMNNKFLVTGLVLGGVALAGTTFAFQGQENRPSEDRDAHRASMQEVMNDNNYEGWKTLMTERYEKAEARHKEMQEKHSQVLLAINSPEAFEKMTQIHELRKSGDIDGANALRAELGLPEMGNGKGFAEGKKHEGRGGRHYRQR